MNAIFDAIDVDGSGALGVEEFANAIYEVIADDKSQENSVASMAIEDMEDSAILIMENQAVSEYNAF